MEFKKEICNILDELNISYKSGINKFDYEVIAFSLPYRIYSNVYYEDTGKIEYKQVTKNEDIEIRSEKIITEKTDIWKKGYFYSFTIDGHDRGLSVPFETINIENVKGYIKGFLRDNILPVAKEKKCEQMSMFDFL